MEKHQKLGLALIAAGCALAAFCGLGLYYVNQRDTMPAMLIGAAVTLTLRLLAAHYRWSLPKAK